MIVWAKGFVEREFSSGRSGCVSNRLNGVPTREIGHQGRRKQVEAAVEHYTGWQAVGSVPWFLPQGNCE